MSPDPEDLGGRRVRRRPIPRQRPRGVSVPWPISPQLDDVPVDQRVVNGTGGARVPAVRPVAGPYLALGAEAHALYIAGRSDEAIALAERGESMARALGDELTVSMLMRVRMYVHLDQGRFEEGSAVGEALLRRYQAGRYAVEEAKTLADLGELAVYRARFAEGLHYLARADRLLETCPRNARYLSAMSSVATLAGTAELYEFAAPAYERLAAAWAANGLPPSSANHELGYAEMLALWALRLDHLGHAQDARARAGKVLEITRRWISYADSGSGHVLAARCLLALGLTVRGETDEAYRVAREALVPCREQDVPWRTRMAHLAYGVALRATGQRDAAERELLTAREWLRYGGRAEERLIIGYELATLDPGGGYLREALVDHARHLWELRLQRLAMLRQAQQRVELESRREAAERQLVRDPLTGLANRRRFDQMMADPAAGTVFLLIDIDKFKAINDTYSHSVGDAVLRKVAELIGVQCRQGYDVAVRYAGDEFAVFLRALDLDTGVEVAERICAAVRVADFDHVAPGLSVTLSIGVATRHPDMAGEELFQVADERLYEAKRRGRDQVAA